MGHAQGQQHMAGIQGAAGTSAAGAGTDSRHIQPEEQAFSLDALKAEADDAGHLVVRIPVAAGVWDLAQALNQLIPHGRHLGHALLHVVAAVLQGRRHGQNAGDGLGARPAYPAPGRRPPMKFWSLMPFLQ